jgi:hypothetical protein
LVNNYVGIFREEKTELLTECREELEHATALATKLKAEVILMLKFFDANKDDGGDVEQRSGGGGATGQSLPGRDGRHEGTSRKGGPSGGRNATLQGKIGRRGILQSPSRRIERRQSRSFRDEGDVGGATGEGEAASGTCFAIRGRAVGE